MWQKCPICNGSGKDNNGVLKFSSKIHTCKVCNGRGIISELTGMPPEPVSFEKVDEILKETPQKLKDETANQK